MITGKIDVVAAEQRAATQIEGIDPELILKVNLVAPIQEDTWRTAGFKILAQEPGGISVLFNDDTELKLFRERLTEYQKGTQADAKNPAYNQLFAAIDDVDIITARDRIGPRLRADGKLDTADFDPRTSQTVDIELWDAPTQLDRQVRVQKIVDHVQGRGGEILSRYIGTTGLIVLRARMRGSVLRDVLSLAVVARVDLPPIPELGERDPPVVALDEVPAPAPPGDAPLIGIIDSGSTDHPLLTPSLIESLGIPASLGTADEWGHGTKVAGIAAFGDLRECVDRKTFESPVRIISVKVVNDQGRFDRDHDPGPDGSGDTCLASAGMPGGQHRTRRQAPDTLRWRPCFALGSHDRYLARELDLIIIVSAGNSAGGDRAPWGPQPERITQVYPDYLVSAENRIVDPATAAIALTVRSLAYANGLPNDPGGRRGTAARRIAKRADTGHAMRPGSKQFNQAGLGRLWWNGFVRWNDPTRGDGGIITQAPAC